ncbi:Rv3235 family protein [Nocardia inohanensis]|uniref:Rv3235 family protein n=1 Tax=Nocardia inohanensis TaxID=209246 RepID=UPI0012FC490B|nr:Rv3235 family protein [Nocardia inohanensis]
MTIEDRPLYVAPVSESRPGLCEALPSRARRRTQSSCRNPVLRKGFSQRSPSALGRRHLRPSQGGESPSAGEEVSGARQFAVAVLRVALEVLDGRRPVPQLTVLADRTVLAAIHTLHTAAEVPGRELGSACLSSVNVIMSDPRAAEVFAGYDRGTRHFALAARIVRGRSGWRLTAFRVC